MTWSKRLKRALICLWIITFMPLCCSGCDYSSLGPILDCISVICSIWAPYVAAILQVVKIGLSYYGRTRAEAELQEAYAENRQPKYDEATRVLTGIGGKDVGAPAGNQNTQAGLQAASQVVAVGARTYSQSQSQPSPTGLNNNTAGALSTQAGGATNLQVSNTTSTLSNGSGYVLSGNLN